MSVWDNFNVGINIKRRDQRNPWLYRMPNPYDWYGSEATNIPNYNRGVSKKDFSQTLKNITGWSNLASGWRAQTPTAYSPEFQQRLLSNVTNTMQKQNEAKQKEMDYKFAGMGMFGQPAHEAMARSLGQELAGKIASQSSDIMNKIQQGKFQDFVEWYKDAMKRYDQERLWRIEQKKLDLERLSLASQMDAMSGGGGGSGFDWTGMAAAGIGALGKPLLDLGIGAGKAIWGAI